MKYNLMHMLICYYFLKLDNLVETVEKHTFLSSSSHLSKENVIQL